MFHGIYWVLHFTMWMWKRFFKDWLIVFFWWLLDALWWFPFVISSSMLMIIGLHVLRFLYLSCIIMGIMWKHLHFLSHGYEFFCTQGVWSNVSKNFLVSDVWFCVSVTFKSTEWHQSLQRENVQLPLPLALMWSIFKMQRVLNVLNLNSKKGLSSLKEL